MKKFLKNAFLISSLAWSATAQAGVLEDLFQNSWRSILDTIKESGAESMCRKGNADPTKGPVVYSLRSFNGQFCQATPVAALAVFMCSKDPANDGFLDSQCYGYAVKALGAKKGDDIKTVKAKAKLVLKAQRAKKGKASTGTSEMMALCQDPDVAKDLEPDEFKELCGSNKPASGPAAAEAS